MGFAGVQRYAQVWGGDNLTDWNTVKFNLATIMGMPSKSHLAARSSMPSISQLSFQTVFAPLFRIFSFLY